MNVQSPCIGICKLNEERVCIGCLRTDDEIQQWYFADNEEKLSILESVEKRRTKTK